MISVSNPIPGSIPTCSSRNYSKRFQNSKTSHVSLMVCFVSNLKIQEEAIITSSEDKRRCECFDLYGELVPYAKAWSWQKCIVKNRKSLVERNEDFSDTLIILQHHPVYTLGTGSSEDYLNFDIKDAPCDFYRTERGGEVTYHGPGQLVMYPIINLRYHKMDLHWYLRALEEVVIRVLAATFSIRAARLEGLTGVWVDLYMSFEEMPGSFTHLTGNNGRLRCWWRSTSAFTSTLGFSGFLFLIHLYNIEIVTKN